MPEEIAAAPQTTVPSDAALHGPAPNVLVVGIGASAGGLAAIEAFFTHLPTDAVADVAFIVVQHLAPDHKSLLSELAQRFTRLPVEEIANGMAIQPRHVYITPPNHDLVLFHGQLRLIEPVIPHELHLPIDAFFRSLAHDQQDRAIGIILSGTGSDGALGVRAVKEAGGMIMVQSPDTAEYAGMPQSALETGSVDYVLPPEEMPAALLTYVRQIYAHPVPEPQHPEEHTSDLLQQIFILLRAQTRHDFSGYKQTALLRRIERRMAIHRIETLAAYVRYLRQTPAEVTTLFREFLIGVTRFFRDPQAFTALTTQVIPHLFDGRNPGDTVRVWVPGCSTGEEAYSLAMLMCEYAGERYAGVKIQIFATDIDAVTIKRARTGAYPSNIAADVTSERLTRFFHQDGNNYIVNKPIRDMVVFAEHNLLLDPPYSHLDLISCRNLLIYLGSELQKQLLPLFHYALNPHGFLFLGSSETIGDYTELFEPVNRKWKIYQRKGGATPYRLLAGLHTPLIAGYLAQRPLPSKPSTEMEANLRLLLDQYLLTHYTPPCVLINADGEILYVHGSTGRYLEPAPGAANLNIIRMAHEELRVDLLIAIRKAVTRRESVHQSGIYLTIGGQPRIINLVVTPLPSMPDVFAIVFDDITGETALTLTSATATSKDQQLLALEQELHAKEDYLQSYVEALTAANEELQSANEELQSTNEELDTSKEESQSVNEELTTVNAELQKKVDELSQANDDMNNLLASIEVGAVFVDTELRIQRYTPAATAIVNLMPGDVGRPLAHFTTNLLNYNHLATDAQQVFDTLVAKEVIIQGANGRWYLMHILPYRTQHNAIAGVVITFVEITRQKTMQDEMQQLRLNAQAHLFAQSVVETVRESLLVLDADLRVISANRAFYDCFQVTESETVGHLFYDLGDGQWNIATLRTLLEKVLPTRTSFTDFRVQKTFAGLGMRTMRLYARELRRIDNEQRMILLAIEDVTNREGTTGS